MRILHGVTGQAGQPTSLAKGLKELGVSAETVTVALSKWGYQNDHIVKMAHNLDAEPVLEFLEWACERYDVFHFHGRTFLHDPTNLKFPALADLLLIKLSGRSSVMHFRGSEIRSGELFAAENRFNYVAENPNKIFEKIPDWAQKRTINVIKSLCDTWLVPDAELERYVKGAQIVPRAIDLSEWPYVGTEKRNKPLIVHAPTARVIKGTDYVLKVISRLEEKKVPFQFKMIEKLSNQRARELLQQADIVIDQLRIGWYGVLAVEAMALGKPVLAYLREDLIGKVPDGCPVISANPETLEIELEKLIYDAALRSRLGELGRAFVETYHANDVVAKQLLGIYEGILRTPRLPDIKTYFEFLSWQYQRSVSEPGSNSLTRIPGSVRHIGNIMRRLIRG